MDRNRRHKKNKSNWNNQNNNQNNNRNGQNFEDKSKKFQFNSSNYNDASAELENQKAIAEIKAREVICPICNQQITDVPSALNDKASGKPAHFECVIKQVEGSEKLGENEKIAYIGQGRFGILYFENPRDQRKFTIKKVIEWEERDKPIEWRSEISELYSKVK